MVKICKSSILNEQEYNEFSTWANSNSVDFREIKFYPTYIVIFNDQGGNELMTYAKLKWNLETIDIEEWGL